MEYLIGAGVMLVFLYVWDKALLVLVKRLLPLLADKVAKTDLLSDADREGAKRKAEQMQKEFDEIINYNLAKALERRRG